jgi:hypothetical protein
MPKARRTSHAIWSVVNVPVAVRAASAAANDCSRMPKRLKSLKPQSAKWRCAEFPVGTLISERPPDSSEQAQFGHSAPTLGV